MAKKVLIFISGIVTGIILTMLIALLFVGKHSVDNRMKLFEKKGDCVSGDSFRVIHVLENGDALAIEATDLSYSTGITVLFHNDKDKAYYDDQIIRIPEGKCAKQIGIFKYESNWGMEKTVPIVDIRDK